MKRTFVLMLALLSLGLPACRPEAEEQKSETKSGQTAQHQQEAQKEQKQAKDSKVSKDSKGKESKDSKDAKDRKSERPNLDPNTGKPLLYKEVELTTLKSLLAKHPDAVLLDVRNNKDFQEGHIDRAQNIDYRKKSAFDQKLKALDKSKTYVIYGYKGQRGERAAARMEKAGFKHLYVVKANLEEIKAQGLAIKK